MDSRAAQTQPTLEIDGDTLARLTAELEASGRRARAAARKPPVRREEDGRLGRFLDDITLGVCILGIVASVACVIAALVGVI